MGRDPAFPTFLESNPMKTLIVTMVLIAAANLPPGPSPVASTGARDSIGPTASQEPGASAMRPKQKITTFLWFDRDAEEAVRFYTSIFKDSKVLSETRWGEGGPVPKGTLMTARFQLAGQEFIALNGGPMYRFTEAISLFVDCETQREVDDLWARLSAGGEPGRCGWLKDKYGLSWQIIPTTLGELLADKDPVKVRRVSEAMLKMDKLDISRLKEAHDRP
jgi:predicted 3-demethylubiquinone-9 3-methyltransferase (glyoxalase superfamily)